MSDEGLIEPLQHTPSLRQRVHETLERLIITGGLPPGAHLVETELAKRLGVSRGPVREALHLLQREGWVDLRPRQGAFVHVPDDSEIDHFFQVRMVLEGEAARLAATRARGGDAADLSALVESVIEAHRTGRSIDFVAANTELHQRITTIGGNSVLHEMLNLLWKRTEWYFTPLVRSERGPESWDEHAVLVRAIAAGDARRAGSVMRRHIQATRDAYKARREALGPAIAADPGATGRR